MFSLFATNVGGPCWTNDRLQFRFLCFWCVHIGLPFETRGSAHLSIQSAITTLPPLVAAAASTELLLFAAAEAEVTIGDDLL